MGFCTRCGKGLVQGAAQCSSCGAPAEAGGTGGPAGVPQAGRILIGRAPDADLVIQSPAVSYHHCELFPSGNGYQVKDLGSSNGTFINSTAQSARVLTQASLGLEDSLFLGSYRLPASKLPGVLKKRTTSFSEPLPRPDKILRLTKAIMTIGRNPESDVPLDYPRVSWDHARLEIKSGEFVITDQSSSNGTYVNGKRVRTAVLKSGDVIGLGAYKFAFEPDKGLTVDRFEQEIAIQARNIWVAVKERYLLQDISFSVRRGKLIGIMGPSGAGKTTMLYALLGLKKPAKGQTLLNGMDMVAHYDQLRNLVGYVPQDDIIHPELTVREALTYAAQLRFPGGTPMRTIDARIATLLDALGLRDAANVLVGGPEKKGVSGGQRKRVNIAMELLTEPRLLFLDEPTSGLASEDAVNVINLLRELTEMGNTVVLTIHQPGYRIYSSLDAVLILCAKTKVDDESGDRRPVPGRVAYYGPAAANLGVPKGRPKDDSIVFFNPQVADYPEDERAELLKDPEAPLFGLNRREGGYWVDQYRNHPLHEEFVAKPAQRQPAPSPPPPHSGGASSNPLHQAMVLTRRYLRIKMRDMGATIGLLAQAPVIGLTLAAVFDKDDNFDLPIFLLVVVAIWFGCINAVTEIAKEKAIYARERMVFLQILPYVMSKIFVLGMLSFVQSFILLGVLKYFVELQGSFPTMLGIMFLCSMGGLGLGLFLSAVRPTLASAMSILPIVLTFQIVLGGAMQFLPDMDVLPSEIRVPQWVAQATVSRWGFEALLTIEENARIEEWEDEDCKPVACEFKPEFPGGIVPEMRDIPHPFPEQQQVRKSKKKKKKTRNKRDEDEVCPQYPQVPVCCKFQDFQLVDDEESRSKKKKKKKKNDKRDNDTEKDKRDDDDKKRNDKNLEDGKCTPESTFESFDDLPRTDVNGCALILLLITIISFGGVCVALKLKDN